MKILHIGLNSCFTEGMLYQDNMLTDMNCEAGHDVTFIANTEKYKNGVLVKVDEQDSRLPNGLRLIRLNCDFIISPLVTKKIQKCRKLRNYLEQIKPEVILYHNCIGYEIMDVAEYIRNNHNVIMYCDTHQDFNNSSTNIISRFVNKYIHGHYLKKAYPCVKKFLSTSLERSYYLQKMYKIPEDMIEDFPLGGLLMTSDEQNEYRKKAIEKYGLDDNTIIFGHGGKLTRGKRTIELLKAFGRVPDERFKLLIFGYIPEEDKELKELINYEPRAIFVGWKSGNEQHELLGAIDLYCQPGTPSSISETAVCDGCALMLARHPSYKYLYGDSIMYAETADEITDIFQRISSDVSLLETMKEKGTVLAKEKLDYRVLANRYLH